VVWDRSRSFFDVFYWEDGKPVRNGRDQDDDAHDDGDPCGGCQGGVPEDEGEMINHTPAIPLRTLA
jgi:hypothetical protein